MFKGTESRVCESLDQILWDEFSYLYHLNRTEIFPEEFHRELEEVAHADADT